VRRSACRWGNEAATSGSRFVDEISIQQGMSGVNGVCEKAKKRWSDKAIKREGERARGRGPCWGGRG